MLFGAFCGKCLFEECSLVLDGSLLSGVIYKASSDLKKEGRHLDDQSSNFKNLIP